MSARKSFSQAILIFTGAAFGGLLSGHLWSSASPAWAAAHRARTVTAEKFQMVDSSGKQRGLMHVTESGMAVLSLNDTAGVDRAELRVGSDGSAGLGFFDSTGRKVAIFGEAADGRAGVRLFGKDGKETAGFGSTPTGESAVTLFDANTGRARIGLGVAAKGEPALILFDQSGADRAELSLRSDGRPGLALANGQGKVIAGLPEVAGNPGSNQ
ncbi:MAG TPA: hypothetical protein VKT27_00295 [Candidatus Binataceae bacterium]|nr:hypothetical protein [Candidatus Binataceae bacterium]